ncbi:MULTISPECIES: ParB/RepB/Spo0J family partition protein [unclassified Ruegeria]|uniref:ParB/RepB/Spo0J family partition protein n=1 Tax=unclassified Ruegeria TaxID=2625375 RepID=UPI001488417E|nr:MULTISPECIES: ParB/RepB/Spo0J family partition protein [unclassified Ruegeria]NOD76067.1 ParB/RepB/Spo0J family partition protein [Ruegeria sp. HKCCD4332]NOD90026.1 ParB/RepB/Spo0J family partition protein [Ruegeria sp. HKCCD4318]NOE15099.1 ParB/RepB/Spo0J family partition protein [Ruegeria sp. HKCCD4318-2]NOG10690.1 ParB/RepB/Spo0J family partition protein [Ruegeria sp. HKCCD4315]
MSAKKAKTRGLGRGLSALMADVNPEAEGRVPTEARRPDLKVPIEKLKANPNQPRRTFLPEQLDELAASVKEKGIIQPLIVRSTGADEYEIVAGERRWRAAQMAQLHDIPVIVRDFDDTEVLEVAIIENIQRADLNAVEEAAGYKQLMDRFGHTQEKLAEALGKSRSHIANLLRLLSLPMDVQTLVIEGKISAGHARALITAENPSELAKQIVKEGLSVRATEALVKKQQQGDAERPAPRSRNLDAGKDADTRALEKDLSAILAMKVSINHKAGTETGQVVLTYENLDQLDDLCAKLSR